MNSNEKNGSNILIDIYNIENYIIYKIRLLSIYNKWFIFNI